MEGIMFTLKMLAAYKEMSIEKLAENCDINVNHLLNVSAGRVKISADDLVKLSMFTGIPMENIKR